MQLKRKKNIEKQTVRQPFANSNQIKPCSITEANELNEAITRKLLKQGTEEHHFQFHFPLDDQIAITRSGEKGQRKKERKIYQVLQLLWFL